MSRASRQRKSTSYGPTLTFTSGFGIPCSRQIRRKSRSRSAAGALFAPAEVGEGAGLGGDRDVVADRGVRRGEGGRAVKDDALARGAASGPRNGDVDELRAGRGELPEVRRARVTQDGAVAAGEDRGEPAALLAQVGVADGVDAAIEAVKASRADPAGDPLWGEAGPEQLVDPDHSVLAGGDPSRDPVGLVEFLADTANKSTSGPRAPLSAAVFRRLRSSARVESSYLRREDGNEDRARAGDLQLGRSDDQ